MSNATLEWVGRFLRTLFRRDIEEIVMRDCVVHGPLDVGVYIKASDMQSESSSASYLTQAQKMLLGGPPKFGDFIPTNGEIPESAVDHYLAALRIWLDDADKMRNG